MKEYKVKLTIDVFIRAEDEEHLQSKLEYMEYNFDDPDDCDELQSEIIDWEFTELGDVEDAPDYLEEDFND